MNKSDQNASPFLKIFGIMHEWNNDSHCKLPKRDNSNFYNFWYIFNTVSHYHIEMEVLEMLYQRKDIDILDTIQCRAASILLDLKARIVGILKMLGLFFVGRLLRNRGCKNFPSIDSENL